jgi:hypothetical protein
MAPSPSNPKLVDGNKRLGWGAVRLFYGLESALDPVVDFDEDGRWNHELLVG